MNLLLTYIERTKNHRKSTMDELTTFVREGCDTEGNKVIDKFFDIHTANVTVELSDGQWLCYSK